MRKNSKMSIESRMKMSESHKGKRPSNQTRNKLSLSLKNSEKFQKHLIKLHKLNIGKKHPHKEAAKKKLSEINTGKHHTKETKDKIRNIALNDDNYGMKNKHHTIETKQRLSEIGKNKCGELASNWQGGKSFEPYCPKFNNRKKEEIRKRDNYQCQYPGCLYTQLESLMLYGQSLHIHHIHYDKPNCEPDLITLCSRHHKTSNGKREYHEKIFIKILIKRHIIDIDNYIS